MAAFMRIDLEAIRQNAGALQEIARSHGVELMAVVKAAAGDAKIVRAVAEQGYQKLGDANLRHIRNYRELSAEKWLLRCPTMEEMPELVEITQGCLISEKASLQELEKICQAKNVDYSVLLMAEIGDLREGCEEEELLKLAEFTEKLPHIRLMGIGANLSCYGNIVPDENNMNELVRMTEDAEKRIGRKLDRISGGNSTSFPMLCAGKLPKRINELRMGEAMLLGNLPCWDVPIQGLRQNTFILEAEIVERKEKPSLPWGTSGEVDSFGGKPVFHDKGRRIRALVAVGKQSIHIDGLKPLDSSVELLGGSSDYLICDVTESSNSYRVGEKICFTCDYAAVATGMSSPNIKKIYV